MDDETHGTIVACLTAGETGDVQFLDKLVREALPKSAHKTLIKTYIKAHAPLKWSKKADGFVSLGKKGRTNHPGWIVKTAEKTPFWDWTPPKAEKKPFSAITLIAKVRKEIDAAIAAGEFNPNEQKLIRNGFSGIVYDYTENTAAKQEAA